MTPPRAPWLPALPHAPGFFEPGYSPVRSLRQFEEDRGFHLVQPGGVAWLPRDGWHHDSVISLDGRGQRTVVRLVLLVARRPGSGTLRRLLSELWFRDMVPAVIEPHERLAIFLDRYGFKPRTMGGRLGWIEWRPSWPDEETERVDQAAWREFSGLR